MIILNQHFQKRKSIQLSRCWSKPSILLSIDRDSAEIHLQVKTVTASQEGGISTVKAWEENRKMKIVRTVENVRK